VISHMNTALDNRPGIPLNEPRDSGVKTGVIGVKAEPESMIYRAGEGIRTLDVHLGKVALYH
jgi:hypothetical protein